MGNFIAYGVWTRISKTCLPKVQNSSSSTPFVRSIEVEQALNENTEVIGCGFAPDQTVYFLPDYTEQFYDLFMPPKTFPVSLPTSQINEYLVLEHSAHCWAVSADIEAFDPNDLKVTWQHMVMPSGSPAIFGVPSFADIPLSLVWPPYRYFEKLRPNPNPIFGIYDGSPQQENDSLGRSIAPEYPDVAYKITDWRRTPRIQKVWASVCGGWESAELYIAKDPPWTLPEGAFPVHPDTAELRNRLKLFYQELLSLGILGLDLPPRQESFEVFWHIERNLPELGPTLGISSAEQASICWSCTYSEEEDALRDDRLFDLYDPDRQVEDLPDRTRPDMILTNEEPVTQVVIFIKRGPSATLTEEEIVEHIIRLAPVAKLKTSRTGDKDHSLLVQPME